jgi:hypothetical protein
VEGNDNLEEKEDHNKSLYEFTKRKLCIEAGEGEGSPISRVRREEIGERIVRLNSQSTDSLRKDKQKDNHESGRNSLHSASIESTKNNHSIRLPICKICLEPLHKLHTHMPIIHLSCGHPFCSVCFTTFCITAIKSTHSIHPSLEYDILLSKIHYSNQKYPNLNNNNHHFKLNPNLNSNGLESRCRSKNKNKNENCAILCPHPACECEISNELLQKYAGKDLFQSFIIRKEKRAAINQGSIVFCPNCGEHVSANSGNESNNPVIPAHPSAYANTGGRIRNNQNQNQNLNANFVNNKRKIMPVKNTSLKCSCGFEFCKKCKRESHPSMTCIEVYLFIFYSINILDVGERI